MKRLPLARFLRSTEITYETRSQRKPIKHNYFIPAAIVQAVVLTRAARLSVVERVCAPNAALAN